LTRGICLVAIVAGLSVTVDLLRGRITRLPTDVFLVTAIATSVTGYFFPFSGVTPAMIVGAIALAILALVLLARHQFRFRALGVLAVRRFQPRPVKASA
jgi:hypothetical protein